MFEHLPPVGSCGYINNIIDQHTVASVEGKVDQVESGSSRKYTWTVLWFVSLTLQRDFKIKYS